MVRSVRSAAPIAVSVLVLLVCASVGCRCGKADETARARPTQPTRPIETRTTPPAPPSPPQPAPVQDASRIVYRSEKDGRCSIMIARLEGAGRFNRASAPAAFPAWSADGGKIVYNAADEGNFEI